MRFHSLYAAAGTMLLLSACAAVQPVASPAAIATATTTSTTADAHADHGDMAMDEDTPVEAMFIDSMIVHHQSAIDMAEAALQEAEHEELHTLAEAIISAQTAEIAEMQEWRGEWYPNLAPTQGMQMDMGNMVISDDTSKPFDQRFIEAMISHHQGAIEMAEMALEQAEREEIRTLAQAIIEAQEAEIAQMQDWLAEWYGVSQ